MLVALEDACGSFPEAISVCERMLDARGHVYPSTLTHVTLAAKTRGGELLEGQAVACHSDIALSRVILRGQGSIEPYAPALEAIRAADLIVLGPGSLFTSIIPNLLVPGVVEAIRESKGTTVFVCGLADVQGETLRLSAREHVEALLDHGMRGLLDYVLVHSSHPLSPDQNAFAPSAADPQESAGIHSVAVTYDDVMAIQAQGPRVIVRDLVDHKRPTWHDPEAFREALWGVLKLCRSRRK